MRIDNSSNNGDGGISKAPNPAVAQIISGVLTSLQNTLLQRELHQAQVRTNTASEETRFARIIVFLDGLEYYLAELNRAHLAVIENDLVELASIAAINPELFNEVTSGSRTPAYLAALLNKPEALEVIARARPESLKITNHQGFNTMTTAADWAGHGTMACLEVIARIDPQLLMVVDNRNRTAINHASQQTLTAADAKKLRALSLQPSTDRIKLVRTITLLNGQTIRLAELNSAHLAVINNDLPELRAIAATNPELFDETDSLANTPALLAATLNKAEALEIIAKARVESLVIPNFKLNNTMTTAADWIDYGTMGCLEVIARIDPQLLAIADSQGLTAINRAHYKILTSENAQALYAQLIALNQDQFTRTITLLNGRIIEQSKLNRAHLAVIDNDLIELHNIDGTNPELFYETDSRSNTPAFLAAILNKPQALEIIARNRPESLETTGSSGYNTMTIAAEWTDHGTMTCLEVIAKINPQLLMIADDNERTAIDHAAQQRLTAIDRSKLRELSLRTLATKRRTITTLRGHDLDLAKLNPAHIAVIDDDLPSLRTIAANTPELFDETDSQLDTPALLAALLNKAQALEIIAKARPESLKTTDNVGYNTMTTAANHGTIACLEVITRIIPDSLFIKDKAGRVASQMFGLIPKEQLAPLITALGLSTAINPELTLEDLLLYQQLFGKAGLLEFINGVARYNTTGQAQGIAKYNSPGGAIKTSIMRELRLRINHGQTEHIPELAQRLNFGQPPYINPVFAAPLIQDTETIWQQAREHAQSSISFLFDTIASSAKPLMIRIAESLAADGIEFIPAKDSDSFPGRGFSVNGLALDKVFPRDRDFLQSTQSWKEFCPNENLGQLINDLEQTKFIFTRGMQIVIPPQQARYHLPGRSLSDTVHYSYVIINEHFHHGEVDDCYLVPTELLLDRIPLNAKYDPNSDGDINSASFTINELDEAASEKGWSVVNIGSMSCFNTGLQNAYPRASKPFFGWEIIFTESNNTRDNVDMHNHLEPIIAAGTESTIETLMANMALDSLQEAHGLVSGVSRRCQYLKNLFNLIYASAHKGLCATTRNDLADLNLTMLAEAIDWHKSLSSGGAKQEALLAKYGYPILAICDARNFSKQPYLNRTYLDTEDMTLRDSSGAIISILGLDLSNPYTIQLFRAFSDQAKADQFDLRFLPRSVLKG